MDIKQLNNWLKDIKVRNLINEDVEVVNNSPLVMIGKGRQGAVFQIDENVCVKVFGNIEDCERETLPYRLDKKRIFSHDFMKMDHSILNWLLMERLVCSIEDKMSKTQSSSYMVF
jgi:hypothetical protein